MEEVDWVVVLLAGEIPFPAWTASLPMSLVVIRGKAGSGRGDKSRNKQELLFGSSNICEYWTFNSWLVRRSSEYLVVKLRCIFSGWDWELCALDLDLRYLLGRLLAFSVSDSKSLLVGPSSSCQG
jgi:hypothetical protein